MHVIMCSIPQVNPSFLILPTQHALNRHHSKVVLHDVNNGHHIRETKATFPGHSFNQLFQKITWQPWVCSVLTRTDAGAHWGP
jgi:hypothetical protein